jgi:predicted AlkP superfamily pyrophosphatase or phosphodiesterase
MFHRLRVFIALLLVWPASLAAAASPPPPRDLAPTVILISFDGWRSDYAQRYAAPNVRKLMKNGTSGDLVPSYPSKTFPNHYTLVTGLRPGRHGIVANNIADPDTGRRFAMWDRKEVQDPMWWGGEPLWVGLERAGQKTAPLFWPGSEAPIGGVLPTYNEPFDEKMPGKDRVDRVLGWLDRPGPERPTFLTLYFEDVDAAGHRYGPESSAVRRAVRRVDDYLGQLLRGLEKRGLFGQVDVVIVSDHGMAETSIDRVVVLDDLIPLDAVEVVDINPTLGLVPKPGREEEVYAALAGANPRLKVYRRGETPESWHYREHPRIPPIVGIADEGWQVMTKTMRDAAFRRDGSRPTGAHGYDPAHAPSMRGLFVAAGPAFKPGVRVPAFDNVNVYPALARILGLPPADNDGDPEVARSLLR